MSAGGGGEGGCVTRVLETDPLSWARRPQWAPETRTAPTRGPALRQDLQQRGRLQENERLARGTGQCRSASHKSTPPPPPPTRTTPRTATRCRSGRGRLRPAAPPERARPRDTRLLCPRRLNGFVRRSGRGRVWVGAGVRPRCRATAPRWSRRAPGVAVHWGRGPGTPECRASQTPSQWAATLRQEAHWHRTPPLRPRGRWPRALCRRQWAQAWSTTARPRPLPCALGGDEAPGSQCPSPGHALRMAVAPPPTAGASMAGHVHDAAHGMAQGLGRGSGDARGCGCGSVPAAGLDRTIRGPQRTNWDGPSPTPGAGVGATGDPRAPGARWPRTVLHHHGTVACPAHRDDPLFCAEADLGDAVAVRPGTRSGPALEWGPELGTCSQRCGTSRAREQPSGGGGS